MSATTRKPVSPPPPPSRDTTWRGGCLFALLTLPLTLLLSPLKDGVP